MINKLNLKDKKTVIAIFVSIIAILMVIGITYAFFSYNKNGLGENTIQTGSIKFIYNESDRVGNGISLTDAMPMPDSVGKVQDKYFDFSVTGTSGTSKLNYEITARKVTGSDNLDEYVKMYLTKINGNNETQKVLSIYDDLADSSNQLAQNHTEKVLYRGTIPAGSTDYTENYRLRMWLNDDTNDGSVLEYTQTETGVCSDTTYTTEADCVAAHKDWTRTATAMTSKVFTVKVNVYANGEMATQQEIADANSTGISSVSVNNSSADQVVNQNYDFYQEVPYGTTSASIEIETANPDATVDIEKINTTSQSNNIRKLSTVKILDLTEGDNYYKITVTSKNKSNTEEYKLKVSVAKSNDATLSSLSVSDCPLNKTFNSETTSYTCTTASTSVTPIYTKGHNGANVVVTGGSNLSLGSNNTLTLAVTAEDGETTKTYTIIITREKYKEVAGDSILKILDDNDLTAGYYKFKINGKSDSYQVHLYVENGGTWTGTKTFGIEDDVSKTVNGSRQYAQNMVVVKVNGNLTIASGAKVQPYFSTTTNYGGPKGFLLYVTGTLTNNGTIDNSHGAYAQGENVYLWKNSNDTYEYVPAVGGAGGDGLTCKDSCNGNSGKAGSTVSATTVAKRGTGGGGSGTANWNKVASGSGGKGSSYSGGAGGGNGYEGSNPGSAGSSIGGPGGDGSTNNNWYSRGGVGNPGGSGLGNGMAPNGTGGLLIIYANAISNAGTIQANGTAYGASSSYYEGGSSGGGSVNIFYRSTITRGTINATGGTSNCSPNKSGDGGLGTINTGSISSGSYVSSYKNY